MGLDQMLLDIRCKYENAIPPPKHSGIRETPVRPSTHARRAGIRRTFGHQNKYLIFVDIFLGLYSQKDGEMTTDAEESAL